MLGTGDSFVTSPPELECDIVDMEGYAIAKVALANGRDITILKYGSDFADEKSAGEWAENVAKGEKLFLAWLEAR